MKKTRRPFRMLSIVAVLFVGTLAAGFWYAPRFFEQQLEAQIRAALQERLHGTADYTAFSLSFFPRFPDLNVSLSDFRLSGHPDFPDTELLRAETLEISLNFWDFWQDRYRLTDLKLESPDFQIAINEEGAGNYAIFRPADTLNQNAWTFEVENWQIEAGRLSLQTPALRLEASKLSHSGYGRIWQQQFELESQTEAVVSLLEMHDKKWLSEQSLRWEASWQWNRARGRINWNENTVALGGLFFELIGSVTEEQLNLELIAAEVSLPELFAVLPLDTLRATGKTDINGLLRGDYDFSENKLPKMSFSGTIREGNWADSSLFLLPLHDLSAQWMLENRNDSLKQFSLSLKALSTRWGAHRIQGELDILRWQPLSLKADLNTELQLHEPLPYLPDSLQLDGTATGTLSLSGQFAPADSLYPDLRGTLSWTKGSLHYPLDSLRQLSWQELDALLSFESRYAYPETAEIRLDALTATWNTADFSASGRLTNALQPQLTLDLNGRFDLSVLRQPETTLSGQIVLTNAEINSRLTDWNTGNYTAFLPTGTFTITDLNWQDSVWMPEGVRLREGRGQISPQSVVLEAGEGFWGDNALRISGQLRPAAVLLPVPTDSLPMVPEISLQLSGKYIEFSHESWANWNNRQARASWDIQTDFDELVFDGLALQNWEAHCRTADTTGWQLQDGRFTWWRGEGRVQGSLQQSRFSATLDFSQIPLPKLHKINWINQYLPLAPDLRGTTSGTMQLRGDWAQTTLRTTGNAQIYDAVLVRSTSLMQALSQFTGLSGLADVRLRKDPFAWQLNDTQCQITPLGFRLGDYPAVLSGKTEGDQIDYQLNLQIPVKDVDEERLIRWFGAEEATWIKASRQFSLPLQIRGSYAKPEISVQQ